MNHLLDILFKYIMKRIFRQYYNYFHIIYMYVGGLWGYVREIMTNGEVFNHIYELPIRN